MGQRTQLYIAEFNPAREFNAVRNLDGTTTPNPNSHGDRVKLSMYHNQWGHGWRMLLDAAGLFLTGRHSRITAKTRVLGTHLLCETDYANGQDPEYENPHGLSEDKIKALCRPFSESLGAWQNMVDFGDNNNGICVIFREVDDYGIAQKNQVLFLRGSEDGNAGDVLTATEYVGQWNEPDTAEVLEFWNLLCKMYGIKEYTGQE